MGDQCNLYYLFIFCTLVGIVLNLYLYQWTKIWPKILNTYCFGCLSGTLCPVLSLCSTFRVIKALVIAYVAHTIFN